MSAGACSVVAVGSRKMQSKIVLMKVRTLKGEKKDRVWFRRPAWFNYVEEKMGGLNRISRFNPAGDHKRRKLSYRFHVSALVAIAKGPGV